ncbi:MAG: diguanylate cyclase domain-containing protein [Desulfonatronovibrio sp.]
MKNEINIQTGLEMLLHQVKKIVKGDQKAVSHLMDLTGDESLPDIVRELAECFGRLTVSIEAREYRVEMILEDLLEKQAELEQAMHDALTGLPNRAIFHEHLKKTFESARRDGHLLAVVFIDLDKFKPVNDTLGHEAGDELLRIVAERLEECVRSSDVAARLGGDEFALILDRLPSRKIAWDACRRVLQELDKPFKLKADEVKIGASIGVAFYPGDGDTPTSLLKSADMAMYQAKSQGRNRVRCYNSKDEALDCTFRA